MKDYERHLEKLLELSNNGCDFVDGPFPGISESDLRFLEAKKYISLHSAGDNELRVRIEGPGLTYFSDKKEECVQTIADGGASIISTILKFIIGLFTGLAAIAAIFVIIK